MRRCGAGSPHELRHGRSAPRPRARSRGSAPTDRATHGARAAFGIARDHPFIDGNKRTAFVAAAAFLLDNGDEIEVPDAAIVPVMLAVSDGSMSEQDLAEWLRASGVRA